jgi:aprataxin
MCETAENPGEEKSQDAIMEGEITSTTLAKSNETNKRNACKSICLSPLQSHRAKLIHTVDLLMSSTAKKPFAPGKHLSRFFNGKDGLGAYIKDPAAFPASQVIYYNDDFVAISDMYPKSSVHTLLLPRSPRSELHPFEAFEDAEFLAKVKEESKKLRKIVASELRRKYGKYSAKEQARERVLNGDVELADGEDLPPGRDWEQDVICGIHSHPSMNHLHVHVISVDRHSEFLRHKKHYNSFATEFFVELDKFPLPADSIRRDSKRNDLLLKGDMKCWRCGRNFGNQFAKLKVHLEHEFEKWKAE